MKIGIPISVNIIAVKELLAPSFHHTQLLGIYDLTSNMMETINLEKENYQGGFSELLKEQNIKVVISPNYTPMVLKLFKLMNIETFKAEGTNLSDNIESFREGTLSTYSFIDAMEASKNSCETSSCGSCSSTC